MRGSVRSCYVSCLLHIETPTGVDFGSYHLLELLLTQEAPAWLNRRLLSLLIVTYWEVRSDGVGQLSPIGTVIVKRGSCAEQSQVVYLMVVNSWHSSRVGVSSYHLLTLLLTQGAAAWLKCRLLYLLVITSWDPNRGGVGQLYTIGAAIVIRSSCAEQMQVTLCRHRCFLRPQAGWSWAVLLLGTTTGVELGSYPL